MGEFEMIDLSTGIGIHTDSDGNQRTSKYDKCDNCNKYFEINAMRRWVSRVDSDEWGYVCKGCDQ